MLPGKNYSVPDIFAMVSRRLPLLVVPSFVALYAALLYSATLPNIYRSDVLIAIVPQQVPSNFVQTTVTLRTEDRIETMTTQIKSRTVLEQLILDLDLYPAERKRLPLEDVVELMREAVEVEIEALRRGPQGPLPPHAFHVRFSYPDPVVATRATERLSSLFVDQNARDRDGLANATNVFLEQQLAEARVRLVEVEQRLEQFRERHGNELPTQVQANMQAMQSMQLQIQAVVEGVARDRDRKMMLERLYSEAEREPLLTTVAVAPQGPQGGEGSIPQGGTAEQQLAAARESLVRLELRLTPAHPDILRSKRMIADLEAKAAAAPKGGVDSGPVVTTMSPEEVARRERLRAMKAEIESLNRQTAFKESEESRLRAIAAEYQRRVESVPGVESAWVALTRDYGTQEAAYKELLAKSETARVAVNLERRQIGEQFRVLDAAKVPERPIRPIRLAISAVGLTIGLLLGLGVAVVLEVKDTTYRSEADVLDALALPVLAVVPFVETAEEASRRVRRRRQLSAVAASIVAVSGYVFWAKRLWTQLL